MFDENEQPVTDNTMKLTLCDSEGNPLGAGASIKDAGSYILKITSTNYLLTGTTELPITITKVDLSELKLFSAKDWSGVEYVPLKSSNYMWDELDIRYNTGVADDDKTDAYNDGKAWERIDQLADFAAEDSVLTVEKWDAEKQEWVKVTKLADRCATEGQWKITLTGTRELAKNYTFVESNNTTSVEFRVVNPAKLVFTDVTPDAWYFESVYEASYAKLMNGYAGTKFFGPMNSITRGQVAVVLYNLAVGYDPATGTNQGDLVDETKLSYNEIKGYETGFDDVDGKAYYGKAIAWAAQAGVVNGYADGSFRPDAPVTRQEFACMLANYAQLAGDYKAAGSDALVGFGDAAQVADFAETSVAWAVENEIMGNGGAIAPGSQISRAEAAAMVCNYAFGE